VQQIVREAADVCGIATGDDTKRLADTIEERNCAEPVTAYPTAKLPRDVRVAVFRAHYNPRWRR
jgi:hypothetical protein